MKLLDKFFTREIYIVIVMALSFLSWRYGNYEIILTIFAILVFINTFVIKKPLLNMPVMLSGVPALGQLFAGADTAGAVDMEKIVFVIVIGVIIYLMLLIDTIINKKYKTKGKLMIPILIMYLAMIVSLINTQLILDSVLGILLYLNGIFMYLYFLNNVKEDKDKIYLSKVMMYISFLVIAQMLDVFYEQGDFADTIINKDINIGWSVSNNIAQYLTFIMPFVVYLSIKSKQKFIYYFVFIIQIISVLMTASRSGYLALFAISIPLIIFVVINEKDKKLFYKNLIFTVLLSLFVVYFCYTTGIFEGIMERLEIKSLLGDSSGRVRIWKIGFEAFKEHPIIGTGFFAGRYYIEIVNNIKIQTYHNILVEMLSTTGIVGLSAFLYFIFNKLKLILINRSSFKWMILFVMITTYITGLLDVTYTNPESIMMIFLVLAFLEFEDKRKLIENN